MFGKKNIELAHGPSHNGEWLSVGEGVAHCAEHGWYPAVNVAWCEDNLIVYNNDGYINRRSLERYFARRDKEG